MSFQRYIARNLDKSLSLVKDGPKKYLQQVVGNDLASDIREEWQQAFKYPGEPIRVHGDRKSLFDGKWTLWVKYGALPQSKDKSPRKMIMLCNPIKGGNHVFRKDDVIFTSQVEELKEKEWMDRKRCEKATKDAAKIAWEEITRKPLL